MRSRNRGAIPTDIADLIDELDDIERRLGILEAPAGEALSSTVAKLQNLVANIQAQLDAWTATRYTNSAIDALIATRAPTSHTHNQSDISGTWDKGVSTGSGITGGSLTSTGTISAAGAAFFVNAYNTDLTGTRRTAWLQNDGRLGYASSSRDAKTSISPADLDVLAKIADVDIFSFIYRAELTKRTNARINDGVDYVPRREWGVMAEDLDAAGLGFFVYYDEAGKPLGVEYPMLVIALLALAKRNRSTIADLDSRLKKIEASAVFLRLGL